jgi:hypothetical protein
MYKFNLKHEFKFSVDSDGEYHSFNDQPAIEYFNGTKIWMKHGIMDRCQYLGPAFQSNIKMEYYTNDKLHCDFGPAVIELIDTRFLHPEKYVMAKLTYYDNGLYKSENTIQHNNNMLHLFRPDVYDVQNNYYTCLKIINGTVKTVKIYKNNNQLHRINGPAFDTEEYHTELNKSVYFYKNKQIDMSKITIFNDDDIIVIYGVNYNNILNMNTLPAQNRVIYINKATTPYTIYHSEMYNKPYTYQTDTYYSDMDNYAVYSKEPKLTNGTRLSHDRIRIFNEYILGCTLEQICNPKTWTTCIDFDQLNLTNYTGPLYFVDKNNNADIFIWVNNGVKENIDKFKISIYEHDNYIWVCGIDINRITIPERIGSDDRRILPSYSVFQINISTKAIVHRFPECNVPISIGNDAMSKRISDLSLEEIRNPQKWDDILYRLEDLLPNTDPLDKIIKENTSTLTKQQAQILANNIAAFMHKQSEQNHIDNKVINNTQVNPPKIKINIKTKEM